MPIRREAIERYLEYEGKPPWPVKGKSIDELIERVEALSSAPYVPKNIPRPHQLEGLAFALEVPTCLIFMRMRLGKSFLSLDWARQLQAGGRWNKGKGLIIAPRPVVADVWESEIKKHSDFEFRLIRNDIQELYDAIDSDCQFIVTAMTGLQAMLCPIGYNSRKERNARQLDHKLVADLSTVFDLAIIDEIHKCGNSDTLSFKIAAALTQNCRHFMGLTGTPHGRDPFKVWAQAFLADRGRTLGNSYHFFQHAFGKQVKNFWKQSGYEMVFDKKKEKDLERKLDQISISYGWAGNMELPEVTNNTVEVRLSDEQAEAYAGAIKKVIESRGQKIQIDATFIRLRQISSGFLPFRNDNGDERIRFFKSGKLEWIEEFLEEAPREAKILILHDFIASGQLICNHLKLIKVPHVWLYGGTKDKTATVKEFQTSKKTNVIVANTAVAELGLDLSVTDYMCFFESPVSPTIRQQAEARPMSASRKDRPLNIDDLISSPVEKRILGFVREGKELLASMVYKDIMEGKL